MDQARQYTRKELLRISRDHYQERERQFKRWADSGYQFHMRPPVTPLPADIASLINDLRCEAKTRAGTPCKRKDIELNGRCKFHGGLSTGPKTVEGKKAASLNGKKSKAKRTP